MERYNAKTVVDELGWITLPSKLRKTLGWDPGSEFAIYHADKNTLILQKVITEEDKEEQTRYCKKDCFVKRIKKPWVSAPDP